MVWTGGWYAVGNAAGTGRGGGRDGAGKGGDGRDSGARGGDGLAEDPLGEAGRGCGGIEVPGERIRGSTALVAPALAPAWRCGGGMAVSARALQQRAEVVAAPLERPPVGVEPRAARRTDAQSGEARAAPPRSLSRLGEMGRLPVLVAFATIYLVWGSTYLAIAYAVETMPPFLMVAARMLAAGGVLYGWARLRGAAGLSREEWRWAAITGTLLFLGGYGPIAWAELRIESGTAALLGTTSPLWVVVIQWRRGGRRPGVGTWAGLGLGMAGVTLLLWGGTGMDVSQLLPAAAVLAAAFFWAAGSLRAARSPLAGSAARSAGAEMLAGGLVMLAVSLLLGEGSRVSPADFSMRSVAALGYLVVFGSIAGFGAYRWLLRRRPPSLVATHSYVNPFVALMLGWLLAGEALGGVVLVAAVAIVGAIALLRMQAAR